jgi:DNA-binding NarL/FixJ family response regulator
VSDAAATAPVRGTVLVVGFRGALGTGLRDVIAGDSQLRVVGSVEGGDVRALITAHAPDVVFISQGLLASVMELRRLVVAYPDMGVVVGVMRLSRRRDDALLAAGARMVIPLTVDFLELRGALKLVARRLVGPPRFARPPLTRELDRLTEREHQVFELLVRNCPAQAIAADLQIASATVNTHTRRIYEKLGVHSRAELIAHAAEFDRAAERLNEPARLLSRDRIPFDRRSCASLNAGRPSTADLRTALGVGRWHHFV